MEDLIRALEIFAKYTDSYAPTHCEHDELLVNVNPAVVSEEDKAELEKLSFRESEYSDMFRSYRFGSC